MTILPELQSTLDQMETFKQWFEKASKELGPFESARQPKDDEWSFVEVIEHLLVPEVVVLCGLQDIGRQKPTSPTLKHRMIRIIVKIVLRNGIKVPVPTERAIPKGGKTAIELFEEWDVIRTKIRISLSSVTSDQLKNMVFDHPIAGPLNAAESLINITDHLKYHVLRAKRVFKQLENFTF